MADTFTIETRDGFRLVEFDPGLMGHDVRILVDGRAAAEMPYPKSGTPFQQAAFDLDGHSLVAVTYLSPGPTDDPTGLGVTFDLFANDRSLRDGASLADVRARSAPPGKAYPGAFKAIDMGLKIAPAASAPGLAIGVTRSGSELGWLTAAALLASMLLAVGVATIVASATWHRIRARDRDSVPRRAGLGCLAVTGIYVGGFVAAVGLITLIRP